MASNKKVSSYKGILARATDNIFSGLNELTVSNYKGILATAASVAATAVIYEVKDYIFSGLRYSLPAYLSSEVTFVIKSGLDYDRNHVYDAAETYLATKIPPTASRLTVSKHKDENTISVSVDKGIEIIDIFEGIRFKWEMICKKTAEEEVRSFELRFNKKHKDAALGSYLPHIIERAKAMEDDDRTLHLYMNEEGSYWARIHLRHPATFDTVAMDKELKREIMEDLARFVKRKEYYQRIGKAWKRGYLLYGPPGTGKSSLVAAMANYLKFDIYDLDLTAVKCNSTLRSLLINMSNKSILLVEDIDCSIDLQQRTSGNGSQGKAFSDGDDQDSKVTLSGLLNLVDGLCSTQGEEMIIVFTTNYKDRLDPALLRPGRMDKHVYMGYCSPHGFRFLASNYHGIDDHPLFSEIDGLIQEVEVTPAQVAEELMGSEDAEIALQRLIKFLHGKRKVVD